MKKAVLILLALVIVGTFFAGCTANDMARSFGGSMEVNLPAGQAFVNATWKETELWYITTPMPTNHVATTYTFQEKSPFGVMQGSVTFIEHK
jgi:hypothetical protein